MGGSINGGVPPNGWLTIENPTINGLKWGTSILGNLNLFSSLFKCILVANMRVLLPQASHKVFGTRNYEPVHPDVVWDFD